MQEKNNIIGLEIKRKIDLNNKIMQDAMSPSFFTLNNTVRELMEENTKLQGECPHCYSDGFCIYCYKMEEK